MSVVGVFRMGMKRMQNGDSSVAQGLSCRGSFAVGLRVWSEDCCRELSEGVVRGCSRAL